MNKLDLIRVLERTIGRLESLPSDLTEIKAQILWLIDELTDTFECECCYKCGLPVEQPICLACVSKQMDVDYD